MSQAEQWDALEVLTEEAAALLREGQADDPRVSQAVTTWAKRAEAVARTNTWGERLDQEDTFAEASLWVLEQLLAYREAVEDAEGTASGFIAARLNWFASKARRKDSPLTTKADFKVAGILSGLREKYYAHGVNPSLDVIREDIRREALRQYMDNARAGNPELPEHEIERMATKRLSKDGVDKSLDILPDLLNAHGAPLSLDQPTGEDGQGTLADVLVSSQGATSSLIAKEHWESEKSEQRTDLLADLALGPDQWARTALAVRGGSESEGVVDENTLEALAKETGHDVAALRDVLRLSKARVSAPHAQWAHLSHAAQL